MEEDKRQKIAVAFRELPEKVQDYLLDPDEFDRLDSMIEKHGLEEKSDKIYDLLEEVFFGLVSLGQLPARLQKISGQSPRQAKKMAVDFAGVRLLPVSDFVGKVAEAVREWGGDPGDFEQDKIKIREVNPSEFVEEVLSFLKISIEAEHLRHRLKTILMAYVNEVRGRDDTMSRLTRPNKVGGMEMTEEQAKELLDWVDDKKKWVQINFAEKWETEEEEPESGQPPEPTEPEGAPPPAEQPRVKPAKKKKTARKKPEPPPAPQEPELSLREEDLEEIAASKEKLRRIPPAEKIMEPEEFVARIKEKTGVKFTDEVKQKRFDSIVMARFRELRDALETRDALERPTQKGGLGLKGGKLVKVIEAIEEEMAAQQKAREAAAVKQKEEFVSKKQEQEKQRTALKEREKEVLNKRYAQLTGRADFEPAPPAGPATSRVTAAQPPEEEVAAQEGKVEEFRRKHAPPVVPKLSSESVPPQTKGKPKMEDVKYTRRLAGPVEELRRMEPEAFRRLSKDPEEATLKIEDKLDLLANQSVGKRLEGIKAFRRSPVFDLYQEINRRVLESGQPVEEVLAERREAGEPVLSLDEINAIRKLSAKLRH
jgi:hypothetical protein